MKGEGTLITPGPGWKELLEDLHGRTILVVGATGTGKSRLAFYLADRFSTAGSPAGLIHADMGQPAAGVPTCFSLCLKKPWDEPNSLWFIGDTCPAGHLLQAAVGTARLAELARARGTKTLIIDTTGLVDGPVARALKYHKALAAGADRVVAIQQDRELEPLLRLLGGIYERIHRLQPVPAARDRSMTERTEYRRQLYQAHFEKGVLQNFDRRLLVGWDWMPLSSAERAHPPRGTVAGLLDRRGFCLGLGLIESVQAGELTAFTAWKNPGEVVQLKLGKVRLDRRSGFAELL